MTFIKIAAFLALLGTSAPDSSKELTFQELTPTLVAFRQAVVANPQAAFLQYSTTNGAGRFTQLGDVLCPLSDKINGWQYFFGTAIGSMSWLNEKTALTMFYCPWADVALLCEWTNPAGAPKISDAELVMGDVLRKTKQPVMTPLFRRPGAGVPPLAIVVATSDTVKAFLDIYGKPSVFKSADWRSKLPNMKTKDQIDLNRVAVGILFSQAQTSVYVFFNEAEFKPLKDAMGQVRQMLLGGKTAEVLAMASETSFESKTILTEVPLDWRRGTMVSLVTDPVSAFVFISDYDAPEDLACFWFNTSKDKTKPVLRRIDIVGHNLSFEQVDAIARQAGLKR